MDAIKALLKQIADFWNGKDKRFKRNAIIIASAVLAVVIIMSVLLNQVDYAVLYSDLESGDNATILSALDTQKVNYKVSGTSIYVPAAEVDKLRLSLSTELKNGFSMAILQQGQGLGMSEKEKQVYRNAFLEQNVRNSIKYFDGIDDAQVMITQPDDSALVITADKKYATVGVILTPKPGVELTDEDARAVAMFVTKAVSGVKPENISIMDNAMRIFDITGETKDEEPSANEQLTLTNEVRAKYQQQVMNLLVPIFGMGNVTAQVDVRLDFDTKVTDSVTYTPVVDKEGIVRNIDKTREKIVNGAGTTGTEPGTTTNTGGTTTYPVANTENGTYEKNTELINYEINEMKEHVEKAKGSIGALTAAVVINKTDDAEDFSEEVRSMVAMALGTTGESVSVNLLPMASAKSEEPGTDVVTPAEQQEQNSQLRFYIVVGAVVLVLLLAMVLLFTGRKKPAPAAAAVDAMPGMMPEMAPGMEYASAAEEEEAAELAAIELVKDSSAKEQIGRLIEKNPELVANLLRTWLADEQE